MTECTPQFDLFSIGRRTVTMSFDGGRLSSDSGVVLLGQIDREIDLCARLAGSLIDRRQRGKVRHSAADVLRQRVLQICAGYEDASDANTLRDDPAFQIALGRFPSAESPLASQATISRFENRSLRELLALSEVLLELWIDRLVRRARKSRRAPQIVLDFDSTDFVTHGEQQLALFHGHYNNYIYYPLLVFDGEGFPVAAVLRGGRSRAGAPAVLLRIVEKLTARLASFGLTLRADAGFSSPELFTLCESMGIDYVIGLITHKTLTDHAEPWMKQARKIAAREGSARLIGEFRLAWGKKTNQPVRRIIVKAEVTAIGDNPRFMITNITTPAAQVYGMYTGRGVCENHIKELKTALLGDRMSCHRFAANQFRLLLHTAAYVLMLTFREKLRGTVLGRMQFDTLRLRLIKVAAQIVVTARRIWMRMSLAHPSVADLQLAAGRLNSS